jgi:hypothetical protein
MKTKTCKYCEETKPVSAFNKYKNTKDGLQGYCRECNREYRKKWAKNPENRQKLRDAVSRYRGRIKVKLAYLRNSELIN